MDVTEIDSVQQFMLNLATSINLNSALGLRSRMSVFLYGAQSTMLASISDRETLYHFRFARHVIIEEQLSDGYGAGAAGVRGALLDARDDLQADVVGRTIASEIQAVVLFQHSPASDDVISDSKSVLRWFMDADVYTTVVGKT